MSTSLADYLGQSSEMLGKQPLEKGKLKGNKYLYQDWRKAEMIVKGHKLPFEHKKTRLDILNGFVEFDMGSLGIKILSFSEIDTLYLTSAAGTTQTFVRKDNIRNIYMVEQIREVVFQGPFQLVKEYGVEYKKSNYNVAMAAGKNYDEARIVSKLYVIEGTQTFEMYKRKKEILNFLSKYYINAAEIYRKNKPGLRQDEDLIAFITTYLEPVK